MSSFDAEGGQAFDDQDPQQLAELGHAALERFEESADEADLDEAVRALSAALVLAPEHWHAPVLEWSLALAVHHQALIACDDQLWDAAIAHLRRAHAALDGDVAVACAAELALMLFQRCHALCDGWPQDVVVERCRLLNDELDGLGTDPVVAMVRALARIDRWRLSAAEGPDSDVDEALALLGASLPEVADDTWFLPEALSEYAGLLDIVDDGDADAAGLRRDAALAALAKMFTLVHREGQPALVRLEAEMLCFRGEDAADVGDLRAGVAGLELFARIADPDDSALAESWWMQVVARGRIWRLAEDRDQRDRIAECCATAVRLGLPTELALEARRWDAWATMDRLRTGSPNPESVATALNRFTDFRAVVEADPADDDDGTRAELAITVAELGVVLVGLDPGVLDVAVFQRLLDVAMTHPDPPPEWATRIGAVSAVRHAFRDPFAGRPGVISPIDDVLEVWAGTALPGGVVAPVFAPLAGVLAYLDAVSTGDRGRLLAARDLVAAADSADISGAVLAMIDGALASGDGASPEEGRRAMERVLALAEAESPDPDAPELILLRAMVDALHGRAAPDRGSVAAGTGSVAELMGQVTRAVGCLGRLIAVEHDPGALRGLLAAEEQALSTYTVGSGPRRAVLLGLAAAWRDLAFSSAAAPGDAHEAVRLGTALLEELGGPDHPMWTVHALGLAESHRRRGRPGDLPRSRELGHSALRGHAWQVLMQSGTDHAVARAHTAATTAATVARWCADDGARDDLVRAVEAGRGLVLHATTTTRGIGAGLAALGRIDLAAEWAAAGGVDRMVLPGGPVGADLHGDLRRRVLRALTDGAAGVLVPPELDRIRAAVAAQGADALVYLIPGRAIAVAAVGPIDVLDLPGLAVGPGSAVDRYAAAYASAHPSVTARGRDVGGELNTTWPEELMRLTRWAWEVAAGPILEAAPRWGAGPIPRLILVPAGTLTLVPWHAAARPSDGGVRYLVEDAVVSYAASARLLCDATGRPPVADGRALVVGNPTANLDGAGLEAQAVHAAFYSDGAYLGTVDSAAGTVPDGRGTPDEVLDRLVAGACPMLHLACHGRAEPGAPLRSFLDLAGSVLSVEALLDRAPTALMALGTVVLAACSTHVSGTDHDEAFSIATALLAAGARTAVGSLWTVPDSYTAHLAFVVHHHLNLTGLRPADALRAAQLWMLDPDRVRPATMSDALWGLPTEGLGHDHPASWAGLAHLGC